MPFEKNKSVNRNGKIYYFNKEKKKIIEASLKEYEITDCPNDVMCDLLSLIDEEK